MKGSPKSPKLTEAAEKYAEWLFGSEKHLWHLATICLSAEVEKPWVKLSTEAGAEYFWNEKTGDATYDHPRDNDFQQLVQQYRTGKLSTSELTREMTVVSTVKPCDQAKKPGHSPVVMLTEDSVRSPSRLRGATLDLDDRSTSSSGASLDLEMLGDHSDQKPETGGSSGNADANRDRWMAAMAELDQSRQLRADKEELEEKLKEKVEALEHSLARTTAAEQESARLRRDVDAFDVQRKDLTSKIADARAETAQKSRQILELQQKLAASEDAVVDVQLSLQKESGRLEAERDVSKQLREKVDRCLVLQKEQEDHLQSTGGKFAGVVEYKDALFEIIRWYEEQRVKREGSCSYKFFGKKGSEGTAPFLHQGEVSDPAMRELVAKDVSAETAQTELHWRPTTVIEEQAARPEKPAAPIQEPPPIVAAAAAAAAAAEPKAEPVRKESLGLELEIEEDLPPPPVKKTGGWDFAAPADASPAKKKKQKKPTSPQKETEVEEFTLDISD